MTEAHGNDSVVMVPIGVIHSPWHETKGMPIQPSRAGDAVGRVVVKPALVEGLRDLDGFSHIILLYHFHRAPAPRLTVVPFLDTVERGLFSTRAPVRPNPIGLSVVRLERVEGPILHVLGIDVLDGTPLLDIKPHVADFDAPGAERLGWLAEGRRRAAEADDRFKG